MDAKKECRPVPLSQNQTLSNNSCPFHSRCWAAYTRGIVIRIAKSLICCSAAPSVNHDESWMKVKFQMKVPAVEVCKFHRWHSVVHGSGSQTPSLTAPGRITVQWSHSWRVHRPSARKALRFFDSKWLWKPTFGVQKPWPRQTDVVTWHVRW